MTTGTMGRWRTAVVLLAVVAATVGCDQVSKRLAAVHLLGSPRQSYLGDSVRLEYAENDGAFLSLGAGLPRWARTALFSAGAALLLAGCGVVALRHPWPRLPLLGLGLVLAGGLSNLVDRVARGSVVDFLNVGVGPVRTGIFNLADVAILVGVALFALGRRRRAGDP